MTLPQDCTVTGIEAVYEQLQSIPLEPALFLDAQQVLHLDLSFIQCLKALEKQNIMVILTSPSDATQAFFRLYQATHFLESQA